MTEMKNGKNKMHYAWWILVTCCVLNATTMGFLVNCNGVYYQPIIREMEWELSQYTFTMIFSGLAAFFTLPIVDRVYDRFPLKAVLIISVVCYALSFALKGLMHSLVGFSILFVFSGVGSAFLLYVPVPMLINAWFEKKRGFATGIAMMAMGIGGAVMNLVLGGIIEASGWRTAAFVQGGLSVLIAVPFIILFAKKTPEEMGLKPYGYEEVKENAQAPSREAKTEKADGGNVITETDKRKSFIICFCLALMVNLMSALPQQLPSYASTCGFAAMIGATLVSVNMIGNTTVKAILGVCIDRFGERKVYLTGMIAILIGLALVTLGSVNLALLYAGAALLGLTAANNVMLPPMAVKTFAGGNDYTYFMSRVSMGTMLATAFSTFIVSWLYDATGDYKYVFLIFSGIQIFAIILMLSIFKNKKER